MIPRQCQGWPHNTVSPPMPYSSHGLGGSNATVCFAKHTPTILGDAGTSNIAPSPFWRNTFLSS